MYIFIYTHGIIFYFVMYHVYTIKYLKKQRLNEMKECLFILLVLLLHKEPLPLN